MENNDEDLTLEEKELLEKVGDISIVYEKSYAMAKEKIENENDEE